MRVFHQLPTHSHKIPLTQDCFVQVCCPNNWHCKADDIMSLTDVINHIASRPRAHVHCCKEFPEYLVNNKYKWEVPLYLKSTWFYQVLWIKCKYFSFLPIKYSSTSSTDKIVLKYKYRYLTTTLMSVSVSVTRCGSVVVSMSAWHADGPGSFPGPGMFHY